MQRLPLFEELSFADKNFFLSHTVSEKKCFIDEKYEGKIFIANNHIAVDCGAVFGDPLGCICLDTMEEIYI